MQSDSGETVLQDISRNIEEYVDICMQIKSVQDELKVFKERKVELEHKISDYMKNNHIPQFNTADGKKSIKLCENKVKNPLNKEYLESVIGSKVDAKTKQDILTQAFDRPVVENVSKIRLSSKKSN